MKEPKTVLFVSAFPPESDRLKTELHGRIWVMPGESISYRFDVISVGVGCVESAIRLTEYLIRETGFPEQNLTDKRNGPDEILFIGSAGVYGKMSEEGDCPSGHKNEETALEHGLYWRVPTAICNTFYKKDLAVLQGKAKIPDIMPHIRNTPPGHVGRQLMSRMCHIVGSCNTVDSVSLIRMPELPHGDGIDFENMEAFALASVADRFGIPFTAIFALTNEVGPDGSDEWKKNFRNYSILLQEELLAALN